MSLATARQSGSVQAVSSDPMPPKLRGIYDSLPADEQKAFDGMVADGWSARRLAHALTGEGYPVSESTLGDYLYRVRSAS